MLSTDNVVYIGKHLGGKFHHSSFLGGAPILAAGMIKVVNGLIVEIHGKNGHYQADSDDLKRFLRHIQRNGVDLKNIKLTPFSGDPITAESLLDGTSPSRNRT